MLTVISDISQLKRSSHSRVWAGKEIC